MTAHKTSPGKTPPRARWTALLLCVLFAAACVFSAAYVVAHAAHHHDHDGPNGECAVCLCVAAAEKIFKRLLDGAVAIFAAVVLVSLSFAVLTRIFAHVRFHTPVALRVRMNN